MDCARAHAFAMEERNALTSTETLCARLMNFDAWGGSFCIFFPISLYVALSCVPGIVMSASVLFAIIFHASAIHVSRFDRGGSATFLQPFQAFPDRIAFTSATFF